MSLISVAAEPVIIRRAGTSLDPYSQEVDDEDWTTATDVASMALCEPRPSSEPVADARNAVVSGWTLYFPADVDITAKDRVIVRGLEHAVIGDPAVWRLGTSMPGVIVQCERVTG